MSSGVNKSTIRAPRVENFGWSHAAGNDWEFPREMQEFFRLRRAASPVKGDAQLVL